MNTRSRDASGASTTDDATDDATSPVTGGAPRGRGRGRRSSSAAASERRGNLVRLAADLFARKGFQATTVREIADEAGILSGSLYHHFDSKESIVDEVLSSYLEDLLGRYRAAVEADGGPREVLSRLIQEAYRSLEPHRAAITVVQNDWNYLQQFPRFGYLAEAEGEIQDIWVGVIGDGQREGVFRHDIDPKLTYRMIRDTIWVAVRWYRPEGTLGTAELAEHFMTVLFDGISVGRRDSQPAPAGG
ncbi:TetR/AcrR family transcriptional regulator [Nocardiopsis suaedae]|uniref:TetR/AcrR family transcriptional regulator n=1 Tax=Nocardiopsis suaedae TaxID=3018444 RepID=A0ABT4TPK5_9ACTN|nr:TetR/AcrR family transcriptional regulator [Nocardiopsis suaedae]MDA2806316.1 TetR/AcrR family transcriptional regulator [Nocardiopsis suaedae]